MNWEILSKEVGRSILELKKTFGDFQRSVLHKNGPGPLLTGIQCDIKRAKMKRTNRKERLYL